MKLKEFRYRHFLPEIILQAVRWYLRYSLSYRNIEELMRERGVEVDRTTLYRWIQHYAPEFEKRIRWYSKTLGMSWRVDETYIKIKGQWKYLYRAIDEEGKTIDFMLSHKRDISTAKKFFKKALKHCYEMPYRINTDRHAPYIKAIEDLKKERVFSNYTEHSRIRYLNNRVESDHRYIKRRIRPMLGFKSFKTANRCIKGIEAMVMMLKQQTHFLKKTLLEQIAFFNQLFHIYS